MRSTHILVLASLTAIGILALIWLRLGEREAPLTGSGQIESGPEVRVEHLEAETGLADNVELEVDGPEQRAQAQVEAELPPPVESDRPRSVRWADYIEVGFTWRGNRSHNLPGYFRPKSVAVYVEGVEQPHPLLQMGKRVRRDTNRFYLTDYYKDEGWKISRVTVDDPRYQPIDRVLDPPLPAVEVELFGSSELEVEAIDAETRERLSGWSAVAFSSSCAEWGSAQLRSHPERRGGWAPVVAADYWVEVRHPEYALGGACVTAPAGGVGHAVVELSKAASLRGRVVFEDFSPAVGARVRVAIPGEPGRELPLAGSSFVFGDSNSIEPYYRWLATTESAEDGSFELSVSATAPMVIEATVAETLPQRVTVDAVAGQALTGVQLVVPLGVRLSGRVIGPDLEAGRGYLIRATGPRGAGEMHALQWDREVGDSFVADWVDANGRFEVGPFPRDGTVQLNVIDAPLDVDPFDFMERTGSRLLHTQVFQAVDGVLDPVEVTLE